MSKLHIKKGDQVMVIAGKDKCKIGEVLSVQTEKNRVFVSDVNILTHHNKPKSKDDKGGIVKAPGAIDASNVMLICPICGKPSRMKSRINDEGKKVKVCVKCGQDVVADVKVKAKAAPKKPAAKKPAAKKAEVKE